MDLRQYPAPIPTINLPEEAKIVLPTGATRNNDIGYARFDLIDPYGLERLAFLYGKGAENHGERNWERGMPTADILNRAIRHLNQYLRGERQEDFPAKVAWAMFAIMRMESVHPEMCNLPLLDADKKLGRTL